jgi:ectoine hydroxylase-related dioxygenase (phytanoyl-CoA dioxygenase family)
MATMDDFTFDISDASDKIVAAYKEHGVIVLKKCLSSSVFSEIANFFQLQLNEVQNILEKYGLNGPLNELGPSVSQLLNSSSAINDQDHHLLMGHFPLAVRLSDTLRDIPRAMKKSPILYRLLDSRELFVHMPINARYILPNQPLSAVPTHQDVAYNTHMKNFCVLWTPFCEIDQDCGGMAVYPGSHTLKNLNSSTQHANGMTWLPKLDVGDLSAIPLQPLSIGDVVIFSDTTVHESVPNTSERIRLNAEVRFFGKSQDSMKHYFDLQRNVIINPVET